MLLFTQYKVLERFRNYTYMVASIYCGLRVKDVHEP